MRLLFAYALCGALMFACVETPDCETPCGAFVYGESECARIALAESVALDLLVEVPEWQGSREQLCEVLKGARLFVVYDHQNDASEGTYQTRDGRRIGGQTFCEYRAVEYGHAERWQLSALAHELAHLFEGCTDHYRWSERGILTALARFREHP